MRIKNINLVNRMFYALLFLFILFGCSEPNIENDFRIRHPNCKLISAHPVEGDMAVVYMTLQFLKPDSLNVTREEWQYWNLKEGWTHRELYLIKDTINNDVLRSTQKLVGKWIEGSEAFGNWRFNNNHTFEYEDKYNKITGVWYLDISEMVLYYHKNENKVDFKTILIDEVHHKNYRIREDSIFFL